MKRLLLAFCALSAAVMMPGAARSQGAPIAQLTCQAKEMPISGRVDVSLFQHGQMTGSTLPPWKQRELMRELLLTGSPAHIPGLLNFIGLLQHGANVIGFDVMLSQGTWGTGQYWVNGMVHRGTIMRLYLVPGGFRVLTEDGLDVTYRCKQT